MQDRENMAKIIERETRPVYDKCATSPRKRHIKFPSRQYDDLDYVRLSKERGQFDESALLLRTDVSQ